MVPPPALVLRSARPDDAEAIEAVRVRGWQVAYAGLLPADLLAGLDAQEPEGADRRRALITAGDWTWVVAEVDGVVQGAASAGPTRDDDLDGAELGMLYVDPEHWSGGLGSALLAAALAPYPRQRHALWVLDGNERAERFYARHGFTRDGARKAYLPGVEEVRMRREPTRG